MEAHARERELDQDRGAVVGLDRGAVVDLSRSALEDLSREAVADLGLVLGAVVGQAPLELRGSSCESNNSKSNLGHFEKCL